jgi:hypothetical protein
MFQDPYPGLPSWRRDGNPNHFHRLVCNLGFEPKLGAVCTGTFNSRNTERGAKQVLTAWLRAISV